MRHSLSQTQLGIYATCMNSSEDEKYNIDMLYTLDKDVDTEKLATALDKVIQAHPYVKSRIVSDENGDPVFESHDEEVFHTTIKEVAGIDEVRPALGRPFDLLHEPLFRLEIYKTKNGNYLYVDFHHIIFDGYSYSIFKQDLADAFEGKAIEKEVVDGAKVAADEAAARSSEEYAQAKEWYEQQFGAASEVDSLPLGDVWEKAPEHYVKYWKKLEVDTALLANFCNKTGEKESNVYTAAFGYTLGKFTGDDEVLYTTVFHGRSDKATRHSFCMMVKTLPVYQNLVNTPKVIDFLHLTREQALGTRARSIYSFADAHLDLGINSDVNFTYQGNMHDLSIVLKGKKQKDESLITHTPGFKFLGMVMIEDGLPYIWCEYSTSRYSTQFVENFWETYANVVNGMCKAENLADIEICTPAQIKLLDSFNAGYAPAKGQNGTILDAFKKAAGKYPDNLAVIYNDKKLTYRALDEMSDRIGAYIYDKIKASGKKEPVVSILVGRSELMTILPLSVMKAGCAYQPLDPSYPEERLNFMVKDSDAVMLIADDDLRGIITEFSGETLLTSQLDKIPAAKAPAATLKPENLFILLYTSGSTGVPKGVMLEHQNLVAFCDWYRKYYDLRPEHRVAAYASFGFDADMMDQYPALTTGAAVVIVPEEKRLDLVALEEYFVSNGVSHSFITTQVGVQFLQNVENCSTLKYLSVGGEKLVSVDPPKDYQFFNGYGPTECTIFTTTMPVLKSEPNIPIGKPTDSLMCQVCDKQMRRLPVGAAGELIIIGEQVGRGYLNRPDKTKEAFFEMDGKRAYHSGDIVRYRPDGNIEFVGRKDGQVKIRGFRIELKEVESVIREFPGIKDCTVQAFDDANGGKFIAAYVTSEDENFDVQALNSFILDRKPPYMVPAFTMKLDRIPLNVNQKVDKKALPKPEMKAAENTENVKAAPLNALEVQLKEIIAPIIKTEDFGVTDILGYFGLTSISSIKLSVQIYKKFGVQLDSKALVKTGTLQSIENEILEKLLSGDAAASAEEAKPAEVLRSAPLSFTQQGVYTECLTNPDTVIYNMPMCLHFAAGVTSQRISEAVLKVLEAHPYIKCHFITGENDSVLQQPIDDCKVEIPVKEMTEKEMEAFKKEFVRPFDLAKGPLFRFEIIQTEKGATLFFDIHHLVGDGASVDLLTHQICQAIDGEKIEIEKYDYYSFVHDLKADPTAEEYFDNTIGGVEEVSRLIPDIFADDAPHKVKSLGVKICADGIENFLHERNLTPAAYFLAATNLAVSRFLCEENVSIATISNGRSNVLVSDTMGMFVNTLPLALQCSAADSVEEMLANTAKAFDDAIAHENYPFAKVASKYGFMPAISYACQLGVIEKVSTKEGDVKIESLELDVPKLPIAIYISGSLESGIDLNVEYDSGLYTEDIIRHFANAIRNCAIALKSAKAVKDIAITTDEDWKQLDSFNPEFYCGYDTSDTAVSRFRKQVKAHPDKPAAVFKDIHYTYRELDEATDRLAEVIYAKMCAITGKKDLTEEVVSIIIDRNEWVYLLPLAVLKTGCAYEPLDPSYPAARLNYMVQDAKASLLLGQKELIALVDEYKGETLSTEELKPTLEKTGAKAEPIKTNLKPTSLMLMLYTSGSTGKPKGVQIEHHNIISFVSNCSYSGYYGEDGNVAAYASFGFDVCMMDIFCTLLGGSTLHVIPEDMRLDFGRLKDYLDSEGITQIFMTTQVGVQFLQNYPTMRTLRFLSMGGEKLPAVHPEKLSYKILNGYGPTENTCGVSQYIVEHWEPNIPLGRPMPGVLGFILDKGGHRLPPGACGEYCVAGYQPARGYLGLPEKTAEVFCELPDYLNPNKLKGLRLYHTGDIVRYRENGDVEFVGRKDGMVKIRGFRIELKEVESAIRPFEGVKDVTVQAYDYESGGKYLAAYVVYDGTLNTEELQAFVKSQKPPYMVPAVVMQIDKIPLTVNQKVDKKALPKPSLTAAQYVAPKGKTEQDFCEIFAEVLGIEKVSADSDFFEIGGSSIIALKVVVSAEKRGYAIVYNDVFSYSTPQAMAEHLGAGEPVAAEEAAPEAEASSESTAYGPGITEIGPDGYDYGAINALLRGNTMEAFTKGDQQPLGDVLLAGATGFLGIHVLKDLIDNYDNKIYCFIRSKDGEPAPERLKKLLQYYFKNDFAELFDKRIFIVEGDATDPKALESFTPASRPFTVVNCAACVKHFSKGNEIELINVMSVKNLVAWCVRHDVRLVHVSTGSVMGVYIAPRMPKGFRYDEHMLYVGQTIDDNQYVHSKFMAERVIYDAILHNGLSAKVMRVGNLAPREKDGVFQVNFRTNNFMATLAAYQTLGMIPYEVMESISEFSPIDQVARAILLLATTPKECICFMPSNQHRPTMGDIVMQLEMLGKKIRMVEMSEFQQAVAKASEDPALLEKMRPFMVYAESGTPKKPLGPDDLNVAYTVQVLYRLGFRWAETSAEYVQKFIRVLDENKFFE